MAEAEFNEKTASHWWSGEPTVQEKQLARKQADYHECTCLRDLWFGKQKNQKIWPDDEERDQINPYECTLGESV